MRTRSEVLITPGLWIQLRVGSVPNGLEFWAKGSPIEDLLPADSLKGLV